MGEPGVKVFRSRKPEIVRDRILDAAQGEFMARGFEGASTNRILESFGGSKPTMFRYFPTKRALFAGVVDRIARRWEGTLEPEDGDPETWLRDFARRVLGRVLDADNLFVGRMAVAEGASFPEIGEIYRSFAAEAIEAALAARLRRWNAQGLLRSEDPERDALAFLDLTVAGVVGRRLYGVPGPDSLDDHVAYCVARFLKALTM
jgi:TetR/AcrR family transcriptional regulator, mexJK operon transcriptional repressor